MFVACRLLLFGICVLLFVFCYLLFVWLLVVRCSLFCVCGSFDVFVFALLSVVCYRVPSCCLSSCVVCRCSLRFVVCWCCCCATCCCCVLFVVVVCCCMLLGVGCLLCVVCCLLFVV